MKLPLSITDNIFFSFFLLGLITCLTSCTKKTTVEKLTIEETTLKAFEEEEIKPIFIQEASFYKSANKPRQITEIPKDPLPPIDRENFVDLPETYDPFAIVFIDDNGGVSTRDKIWYTFDYDKDNANWHSLSFDESTYINYNQKRWGGKIPKWFKASIESIGLGGGETVIYINTLKQKKDVYLMVQGAYLGDEYTSSANVISENCSEPEAVKKARLKKEKEAGKETTKEEEKKKEEKPSETDNSREDAIITESSKYKTDNTKFDQCLKWYYNTRDYSYWSNGYQEDAKPNSKTTDPIKDEGEPSPDSHSYNI